MPAFTLDSSPRPFNKYTEHIKLTENGVENTYRIRNWCAFSKTKAVTDPRFANLVRSMVGETAVVEPVLKNVGVSWSKTRPDSGKKQTSFRSQTRLVVLTPTHSGRHVQFPAR